MRWNFHPQYAVVILSICFIWTTGFASKFSEDEATNTESESNGRSKRFAKGGGGGMASLFGMCTPLPGPKYGSINCNTAGRKMTCTAMCPPGFQFADETKIKKHVCNNFDGTWLPSTRFPDCDPVCQPACERNGKCIGNNRCLCTPDYRGDHCQYPVSNCDVQRLHPNGGYSCNHTMKATFCSLSCPSGMDFESPPETIYECDLRGNWLQTNVPKCRSMESIIVFTTPSPFLTKVTLADVPSEVISLEMRQMPKEPECSTWGQVHYKTFDGAMFDAQGSCTYLLAQDCDSHSFSIHVQNDNRCNGVASCHRSVIVFINYDKYVLNNIMGESRVYWNGNRLKIPTLINGLLIEKIAQHIVIQNRLKFSLKWNGKDAVSVQVTSELYNKTCGLCGRFNGNSKDDFELNDGSQTTDTVALMNSWKMNSLEDVCPDSVSLNSICTHYNTEAKRLSEKADQLCANIFDKSFTQCHVMLRPHPYYWMCRTDVCTCGANASDCMCSTFSKYFQECHRRNKRLDIRWRRPDLCPSQCPEGMIFQECGSSCPQTCKKGVRECEEEQHCIDGCQCPRGMLLHDGKCIRSEECPCHHAGKSYADGQSIQQDCNSCICDKSKWKCTTEKCEARCSAVGDPHYTTFDGRHYNFMGKCSYYLVQGNGYSIEQENVACSGAISENMGLFSSPGSGFPSCTKSVIVKIRGTLLRLKQKKEVVINGKEIEDLPVTAPGVYVYMASSLYVKAELENGLIVTWDGASRVDIDAPPSFLDKTKGLCGTFNYNQKDDFLTSEGDIEQDVNAFANKWKTKDSCSDLRVGEALDDPCEMFSQKRETAQILCGRLKSDIFADCFDVVNPETFYRDCVYDMCYCQDNKVKSCLCPAIANYAAKCAKKNVLVNWRSSVRECGINCPGSQVYQVCGSACKRSCVDISYHPKCHEQCVEGCNCPQGMTLNANGECILISNCPCLQEGKSYPPQHKDIRGNQTCECSNAKWECRASTEEELQRSIKIEKEVKPMCSAAANMEYAACVSDWPLNCKNMHSPPKRDSSSSSICKPGCICKSGYFLDGQSGRCVKPTQCPCHHGGQSYSEGAMIQEECNKCVCEGGAWNCEKKECPAVCMVWGENHFHTFDGRTYEFHGDCDYVLVRGDSNSSEKFQVAIHNVLCGTSEVTCSKSVTLTIGEETVTLTADKPLPKDVYGLQYVIRRVGLYVFVHTDVGVTLQWDRGTGIHVRVDVKWKGKVEGLCGDFNGDENDDFKTPDGGPSVAQATMFGDSWRLDDYCPTSKLINNTCDIHPHRKDWSSQRCSVLKSAMFKPCHSEVPYEPYLEKCIFDVCGCDSGGDCHCLCTVVATYAQECSSRGIAIAWRSQDVCAIQCAEGEAYNPCIPVCPLLTCETQYLYSSVEESCAQEVCVEGCQPKPCPPDQIYNNDREYHCIPKTQCVVQPCRVVNGKMYHEGEKIKDPQVADPCQSCHCRNGDVVCAGRKCAPSTVMPTPTPAPPGNVTQVRRPSCEKSGWTRWMNGYSPNLLNGGDYETIELLRQKYSFCPLENTTRIQCQTAITHVPYKETGQVVWCALPQGLICENTDQSSTKLCNDYEVRVFCQCGEEEVTATTPAEALQVTVLPTPETILPEVKCTAPGWTEWMNRNKPRNDDGEYELIPELRKHVAFCADNEIANVECKPASTSGVATNNVECTKDRGLVCRSSSNGTCQDYKVRFFCQCDAECSYPRGLQSGGIPDYQISASSSKADSVRQARLRGPHAWVAGVTDKDQWLQVALNDVEEITGIITQGNPEDDMWTSLYKLSYNDDDDGDDWKFVKTAQGNHQIFFGNDDRNSLVKNEFNIPETTRYIRVIPLEWYNGISMRLELLGCNRKEEESRRTSPQEPAESTTTERQPTRATTTTTKGTPFPYTCTKNGWTDWMSTDNPDTVHIYEVEKDTIGDYEPTSRLHYFYSFCADPTTVECRSVVNKTMSHLTGQDVRCDLDGLQCSHKRQSDGKCLDYELRFYCQCERTTESPTTVASTTTTTTPSPEEEKELRMKGCKQNGWTDWMNMNKPMENVEGDIEAIDALRFKYTFCYDTYISDMECRETGTNESFKNAGQYGTVCEPNHGFKCLHSLQPSGTCKDYEVRIFCLCPIGYTEKDGGPSTAQCVNNTDCSKKPLIVDETDRHSTWYGNATEYGLVPVCDAWTAWINVDSPYDDSVDEEVLDILPGFHHLCPKPIQFDCRDSNTKLDYKLTGQKLAQPCNVNGIVCKDDDGQDCHDYEIRAFCLCPTVPEKPKCVPGYTDWFDTDNPEIGDGDYEKLELIQQRYQMCKPEYITDIECQGRIFGGFGGRLSVVKPAAGGRKPRFSRWVDYEEVGDIGVQCTPETGLSCMNRLQAKGRKCRDYRVRFYCSCTAFGVSVGPGGDVGEKVIPPTTELPTPSPGQIVTMEEGSTVACGWTKWLNADRPTAHGDFETLKYLKMHYYNICDVADAKKIECRLADSKTSWDTSGQHGLVCDVRNGMQCHNLQQIGGCYDYEVRFLCLPPFCQENATTVIPPVETIVTTATPPCRPGSTWDDCAYRCDNMCQSYLHQLTERNYCNAKKNCVPGCVASECKSPNRWRDKDTCVKPEDCTCLTKDGQLLPPGEIVQMGVCEQCQCVANVLECAPRPGCANVTTPSTAETTVTEATETTEPTQPLTTATTAIVPNIIQEDCWTSWINIDSSNAIANDLGDFEDLSTIRTLYSFCADPIEIECRVAHSTRKPAWKTGQNVQCNVTSGLRCWNRNNLNGCFDYEVRFFCPCAVITTEGMKVTSPSTTPLPPAEVSSTTVSACVQGHTPWFDAHTPDATGEYETIPEVRRKGFQFCGDPYITSIECRVKDSNVPHSKSNDSLVKCNLMEGLSCENRLQQGHRCSDYEVRFYCDCRLSTIAGEVTTATVKLPTTGTTAATPVLLTTAHPPCSYSSEWINVNKPWLGSGDSETLERPTSFCQEGVIEDIECVTAEDNIPFSETKEEQLSCSVQDGFVCKNRHQPDKICHDYKIRYFCGCPEVTTTRTPTTTTQPPTTTIIIVPAPSPYPVPECHSYTYLVNGDTPVSDTSLKASSSKNTRSGPSRARLNASGTPDVQTGGGGSWTAAVRDRGQYIQVDLSTPKLVYGIATQGDAVIGSWVTSYSVLFSNDGISFSYVPRSDGGTGRATFTGNYENHDVKKNLFKNPIEARFVRVLPLTWEGDISLRFDLLGCQSYVTTTTTEAPRCDDGMGLENGTLSDYQLSASSVYVESQSARKGRLNGPGNWSPKTLDKFQYLQVDFLEARVLSGVVTQGKRGTSQWVTSYQVQFSSDNITWTNVTNDVGQVETFAANFDSDTVVSSRFHRPIRARFLRIVPQTWHNWISMRLEVLGCFEPYPTTEEVVTQQTTTTTTEEVTPPTRCDDDMGMESGDIKDNMITVSSTLDGTFSAGSRGRLNLRKSGAKTGAWVAAVADGNQFLQVNFGAPRNITGIVTQGRERVKEWVKRFKVLYGQDGQVWTSAKDENGRDIFTGNADNNNPVPHMFLQTYLAQYIRVVPVDWNRWISMRLEIIGCFVPYRATTTSTVSPLPSCKEDLNAIVPKFNATVSSSLAGERSGARRMALDTPEKEDTGGWVAGNTNRNQYVLMDYGQLVSATGIVTQGRNKHPEWVTEYQVLYSEDGKEWTNVHDEKSNRNFRGNRDSNSPVEHYFHQTIVARYIKVVPTEWKNWISLRLKILGCLTVVPLPTSPPPTTSTTVNPCYSYGAWLSTSEPSPSTDGDIEPIGALINASNLCRNPVIIECREALTKRPLEQVGQKVSCDLTDGLVCLNANQGVLHNCYNYEARIACYVCGPSSSTEATSAGTVPPPPPVVVLCPEVLGQISLNISCPDTCPPGYMCDGGKCVDPADCPCVHDGRIYQPSERFVTKDCDSCLCKLRGHSYCVKDVCPTCADGHQGQMNDKCQCECKTCPEDDQVMCPSNGYCLAKSRWCDGYVDCPDDERNCPATTTTCPPPIMPTCTSGTVLVPDRSEPCPTYSCKATPTPSPPPTKTVRKDTCEMSGSFFKTFDGYGYKYDNVCDHVLFQDNSGNNRFNVTVSKNCSSSSDCSKYIRVSQNEHVIVIGGAKLRVWYDGVVYTGSQLIKLGRRFPELIVKIKGESVLLRSQKYGFEVTWSGNQNVRIGVSPRRLMNKVRGLCGFYSDNPEDDRQKPDGVQALTVAEFGDSWKNADASSAVAHCVAPTTCPSDVRAKATAACNELLMAPFDACHQEVDPAHHIQICIESICECLLDNNVGNLTEKECRCKAYLPYVEACETKGVFKIRYWRINHDCLPQCPPGLVWNDCGTDCERTCDTIRDFEVHNVTATTAIVTGTASTTTTCDSQTCVPGCYCPNGLVQKNDHCVQPEKCLDCVCTGYGDPHYFTYDGHHFPFQGNCTYVLSQDVVADGEQHRFKVLAINENCHNDSNTTCTVGLRIFYNGHSASIRFNGSVAIDDVPLRVSDFPYHDHGFHVESISGKTVVVTVPKAHLEVRYSDTNHGFEIKIPSQVYHNKTEGLCGSCNGNSSDDMRCKGGKITGDPDEFGISWLESPADAVDNVCKAKEAVVCKTSVEQDLCDVMLSDDFVPCHMLVNPDVYIASCRADVCHSADPTTVLCSTVTEYARQCAEVGICIQNWRKTDFCPHQCPAGMYYDQCGPACPKSCKDVVHNGWASPDKRHGKDISQVFVDSELLQELIDSCDTTPVDGCFCIGGTVLLNGSCVDPVFCEPCDAEGHNVGDTWKTDQCTSCKCTLQHRVECVKEQCAAKPICTAEQQLAVLPADNSSCCELYECVAKTTIPTCPPSDMPDCEKGEMIKSRTVENGCQEYFCECDKNSCPPLQVPVELEVGQDTHIETTACCPVMEVICVPEKCPEPPKCGPRQELKERLNAKSKCCKEYYCESPPNICFYTHQYEVVNGTQVSLKRASFKNKLYKFGDVWTDGLCRKCTCEQVYGLYKPRCSIDICPTLDSFKDKDDYQWAIERTPNKCCPEFKRVLCIAEGKNYTIGQEWPSPDGNKCKLFSCKASKTGDAIRVEHTTRCDKNCVLGFVYVEPPATSPECCGVCTPTACVEDGKLYQVGDTWNSTKHNCTTAECIKAETGVATSYNRKACKGLPIDCTQKILDSDGCCEICNATAKPLDLHVCMPQKVNPNETIGMFQLSHKGGIRCRNRFPVVDMKGCVGRCESTAIYSSGRNDFINFCLCCAPEQTEKKTILLDCSDGKKRPFEYAQPVTCDCTECRSSKSAKPNVTLTNIV